MGQSLLSGVFSFMVGHLYVFLKYILPEEPKYRHELLETPRFFKKIVDWIAFNVFSVDNRPPRQMNNIRNMNEGNQNQAPRNSGSSHSAFRGSGTRLGGE